MTTPAPMPAKCLVVRKLDGTEVHRIPVSNPTQRKLERVIGGLLINMSPDFYIDDSEFDDVE